LHTRAFQNKGFLEQLIYKNSVAHGGVSMEDRQAEFKGFKNKVDLRLAPGFQQNIGLHQPPIGWPPWARPYSNSGVLGPSLDKTLF
jgi:hypothetical protein